MATDSKCGSFFFHSTPKLPSSDPRKSSPNTLKTRIKCQFC